jgi:uncharacterized protein (DUF924 family)
MSMDASRDILDFWFGAAPLQTRPEWFRKDAGFDQRIRSQFGDAIEAALATPDPAGWPAGAEERLARILLLDQFTRNTFRDTPRAFAGDAQALALALALIDSGADRTLAPLQRWFAYLPLEHAEDLALQQRSVALYEAMAERDPAMAGAADYARRHRDVIAEFGRFPHRNRILGRDNTAAEAAYLARPGAGF